MLTNNFSIKFIFKTIIIFLFGKLFFYQSKISQEYIYNKYRKKYKLPKSFVFSGNNIRLEGSGNIIINENCHIGNNSWLMSTKDREIRIGKNCRIGPNTIMLTHNAFTNQNFSVEKKYDARDILIGDYTWIGANTFIKQGVKIGNNCIIQANSVVKESIDDFTFYNNFSHHKLNLKT